LTPEKQTGSKLDKSIRAEQKVEKATVKVTYFETESLSVPIDLTIGVGF
jgi:hypothetical protein